MEPDLYLKAQRIGWLPAYRLVLLADPNRVVNRALLECWAPYIRIVSQPLIRLLLAPIAGWRCVQLITNDYRLPDGRVLDLNDAGLLVNGTYELQFPDRALLTLPARLEQDGQRFLEDQGLRPSDWFACLHVREGGYLSRLGYHSFRDADVDTYLPAIRAIVNRGGWVIRVGDPTMKKLSAMDRVMDYAHSPARSDWLDAFLWAKCRFFLGTTSGPFCVSYTFGRPCVLTNFVPMGAWGFSRRDITIFKLYQSATDGRLLSFPEVLGSRLATLTRTEEYAAAGIHVVDNSPDEIAAATIEMMDTLEGRGQWSVDDECRLKLFRSAVLAEPRRAEVLRVGRSFLRKYADLLQPAPDGAMRSAGHRAPASTVQ